MMVVFNISRWFSTRDGRRGEEAVPEKSSAESRIEGPETTPMMAGLFRPFWILAAGAAVVPLLALAVIAVASARSLDRFEAVHRHAAELSKLLKIEERVARVAAVEESERQMALAEPKRSLAEVLSRRLYLAPETEAHLRKAAELLEGRPLDGIRELEEGLEDEVTAHDSLLLQVERDTQVELTVSSALIVGLPLLGALLALAFRKRFLGPLDQLRGLMSLLARREYRTAETAELDPLLQPVFRNYNDMASRLFELERQHLSRQRSLEEEVRSATGALLQQQRELARSQRLAVMGELAAGVAHELRNPLAGIQMALDAIRRETRDQDHASRLSLTVEELRRVTRLLNELLNAARPAHEPSVPIRVARLASEFASLARYQIPEGIELRVNVPEDLECRLPDGGTRQALWNLVLNSIQAIGSEPGEVEIAAVCEEGRLRLSVTDDGPGFPPEYLDAGVRSFTPLRPGGTGLGLAIVRRFARDLGGELLVENRAPSGASVSLVLPCREDRV
jgi:signal transduction histidine kinase